MGEPSADEHGFGRSDGSKALLGWDAPTIGAAAMITVDGIAERESGKTPPPPPVSLRAIVIALVVMFLLGLGIVFTLLATGHRLWAGA